MMHTYKDLQNITVAELVIKYLELEGVEYVFGIPGGYIHPFLKLLREHPSIRFIISRHEEGAAFMADGYARTSGKLGVVFSTAGPGATNALTGLVSAHTDGVPLLLITGQTATDTAGKGAIQDSIDMGVNITDVLGRACGFSETAVSAANFPLLFSRALQTAFASPRQAVHLSIPLNIASATISHVLFPEQRVYDSYLQPKPLLVEAIVYDVYQLLQEAERPVILLGAGCREAFKNVELAAQFEAFAHSYGIGVITSPKGKGLFPESTLASLGVFGMGASRYSETYFEEAAPDVVLVLGSSLNEWATGRWSEALQATQAFIHVDLNAKVIGRAYRTTHRLQTDIESFLTGLFSIEERVGNMYPQRTGERLLQLQLFKNRCLPFDDADKLEADCVPLKPQSIFHQLSHLAKDNAYSFFVDMGNCTGYFSHFMQLEAPAKAYVPCGFSSMGWASGAVIGGQLGSTDTTCICVTGDGAFLMNGVELQVAARYSVGVVYIVLYDNFYGMVHHGEMTVANQFDKMDDPYYDLGAPDLVQFAESLGATAYAVTQPGAFEQLLPEACANARLEKKPQVLVVSIDHREKPPLGNRFKSLSKQLIADCLD
ncbi:thiamine pyrophosphate-binding protein [Flavisolibacter tropicus]|uniref:thiamine pyrophosphate-binding protein n=1 Tax=Flavisolibacter tropicus TaxID=1492898 RepID=UPI0013146B77|nr:thiamine pyrophosphate-binding protein [Flavisolibacter tropicus]